MECEAKPFLGRSAPFRTIQSDVQYPDTFGCVVLMGGEHGTLARKYRRQLQVQDAQGSGMGCPWRSWELDGTLRLQSALPKQ